MKNPVNPNPFIVLGSAFLFYFFFYDHTAGLNIALISLYSFGLYFLIKRKPAGRIFKLLLAGTFILSLAVVIAHTPFSIFIFWSCFLVLLGNFAFTEIRHLHNSVALFFRSLLKLPASLFSQFRVAKSKRGVNYSAYIRFIILPVLTLITVFVLYSSASEPFNQSVIYLQQRISDMFADISFPRIFFFLLGVLIFGLCFVEIISSRIINADASLQYALVRKKKKSLLRNLSRLLLRKRQMAIALFALLNLMIFWLNYLDITHVWFGFHWDGGYLKAMVHEGTWLLIMALIVSIFISVYYLNSNLVFFKRNKLFNALVIAWLTQNIIMVVSVAIRNSYYINYFALAYLRIFVYFFLAACLVGLLTIIFMIRMKKSTGYLLSVNSLSVFILLVISCCFNWDVIIARYNFAHYNKSFVHYDFLAGLNDSALPYMNYTDEQLMQINAVQSERFSFTSSSLYTKIDFPETIKQRKEAFKKRWEQQNFLEWNYPEYKAYHLLFP